MGLIAWWPLNGELNNLIDLSNPLVNTNTTYNSVNTDGKIGKCYKCTSNTAGTLRSTNKINLGRQQSMFCWIYMDTIYTSSSLNAIMGQHRYQYPCGMGLTVRAASSTTGYVSINTGSTTAGTGSSSTNGGYRTYNNYRGSTLLETGQWYHLGYTYNEGTINLYVNGNKETIYVGNTSSGLTDYTDDHLKAMNIFEDYFGAFMWSLGSATVGDSAIDGNYLAKASMNDIRIYDHALTVKEVKEIYKCKMLDYKFNDPYVEGTTNMITSIGAKANCTAYNNGVSVNWKTNSADTYFRMVSSALTSGSTYTLSFDCDGIRNATVSFAICNQSSVADHLLYLKDGHNEITFVANSTDVSNSTGSGLFFDDINRDTFSEFTIDNLQLEEKDHSTPFTAFGTTRADGTVFDCSGFGNNAKNYGCIFDKADNSSNNPDSLKFNGSTSYVEVPNFKNKFLKEDWSVNFWVKHLDNTRAIYFGDFSTTGSINFNIERTAAESGYLRVYYNNSPNKYFTTAIAKTNEWTMISLVFDKTSATLKAYSNGVYRETLESLYPTLEKTSGHFRIGRDNRSDTTALYGNISEFTFYGTCLSNEDILQLYQSKFEVDKCGNIFCKETNEYVIEDGVDNSNLIYNGNLITKSNAGFSATTYDSTLGAIKVISQTPLNDDFIEISENSTYKLSLDYYIQTAHTSTMYFVIFPYDIDKKFIDVTYTLHQGNTTLAADLVSGATTISLSSGTSWATSASASHMKYVGLCYSTAFGYNRCMKLLSITDTANNVATLKTAYSGVTVPSGTKIANFYGGGSYYYPGTLSASAQTSNTGKWVHVEFTVKGNGIRYGTRYIKIGMLSYTGAVYFRNMRFEHVVGNDEYKLQLLQRNVSNKESTFLTKRYKASNLKTLLLEETGMNIRYIRDVLSGNSVNSACHWVEVQAFNGALQNVLFGRTWQEWTETSANLEKIHRITDGLTATGTYWEDNTNKKVTFDLGSVMNIKSIKVWHYYGDSRKYNNKTEVSADGTNWITVFDSAVSGTYTETSAGHEIFLNPVKTADYRCGKVHSHCFYEK